MAKVVTMTNARTWKQWATLINGAWRKGVASIVETGQLLRDAKEELDHGAWEAMVSQKLNFNSGTALRLRTIAENTVLANPAHGPDLPPSWRTLFELTKIDKKLGEGTLLTMIKDGTINPKTQRRDVTALLRPKAEPREPTKDKAVAKRSAALVAALKGKSRYEIADTILDIIASCRVAFVYVSQREHQRARAAGRVTDVYFGTELSDSVPEEN